VPSYRIGSTGLISLAYCAVFPTVLCFTLQNLYQRYVSPTRAGLVYTLDPVWSLLAGFVVLGERLSAGEWLGCLLILLAVLLPLMVRCIMERRQE
jgi:drug/metabolite transporter (DMT)-like permease